MLRFGTIHDEEDFRDNECEACGEPISADEDYCEECQRALEEEDSDYDDE
jgi:predicted amidophosphoribosyltransferase